MVVVGYDQVGLYKNGGAKGVGASFVRVDGKALTLADLTVTGYGASYGGDYNWGIYCQKLTAGGASDGENYFWVDYENADDGRMYGWVNGDGEDRNDIPLTAAEGVWMYSPSEDMKIVSSGQVPDAPISVYLHKNGGGKLVINPMPVMATFGEYITVKGYGASYGGDYNWGIYAQRLTSGGASYGENYFWVDYENADDGRMYGWVNGDGEDRNDETLPAGEALWVYSPSEDFYVEFKSPLEKPVED